MVNTEIRLIIFFAVKDGEALYSQQKTRPRADCGSDHELLIAKFRLKLKKVGKTTRPFKYDLNQIPYDYKGEVTNRFKGLDLIECLKNYGQKFMTLFRSSAQFVQSLSQVRLFVTPWTAACQASLSITKFQSLLKAFFVVQLSHPYMTTGKTIALSRRTFVGKVGTVMSMLFNMLFRLVITFLPRSKCLLISWLQSPSVVILEPQK